jgi:hypothetical protein
MDATEMVAGSGECAAPLDLAVRHALRMDVVTHLVAQRARLEAQLRLQINALILEDTPFISRKYVADASPWP